MPMRKLDLPPRPSTAPWVLLSMALWAGAVPAQPAPAPAAGIY
jgi:hypothetical protein